MPLPVPQHEQPTPCCKAATHCSRSRDPADSHFICKFSQASAKLTAQTGAMITFHYSHTCDTVVGKRPANVTKEPGGLQHSLHYHRLEHIQFKVTAAPRHGHCYVVAHHLGSHHRHRLTLRRVHFTCNVQQQASSTHVRFPGKPGLASSPWFSLFVRKISFSI